MFRPKTSQWTIATICFLALTGSANAKESISIQGGSFSPWRGDTGASTSIQYLHQFAGGRHHLGVEFEYRNFDGEVANIEDIHLETYLSRILYRVDLALDSMVTPYFGLGFGVGANYFRDSVLEQGLNARDPGADFDLKSAAVVDMVGLFGVDVAIPDANWVSLFGEARFMYTAQFTNLDDKNREPGFGIKANDKEAYDSAGGAAAQVGVRFRF